MNTSKIGNFILKLRKENKMTQQELADKLFVTDKAVSKWENGRCMPDVSLFEPLCKIFNVSVSELLNGERIKDKSITKTSEKILIKTIDYSNRKIKKVKKYYILLIASLLLIICYIMFISDYNLVLIGEKPNFMFKLYSNENKSTYIGPGYKMIKYKTNKNTKFGFWIFTWNISQIDTMPPKLTIINGDKRILTETGSYCIKTSENGKIINTCSDSISPTEFEYKTILKAFPQDIISINDDSITINKVIFYDTNNGNQVDIEINHEKHNFIIPNIKGIYYVKLDTSSKNGKCWYSFKIDIN